MHRHTERGIRGLPEREAGFGTVGNPDWFHKWLIHRHKDHCVCTGSVCVVIAAGNSGCGFFFFCAVCYYVDRHCRHSGCKEKQVFCNDDKPRATVIIPHTATVLIHTLF